MWLIFMINLVIDYLFTFDIDNILEVLHTDYFNCSVSQELPDWWISEEEKAVHARELEMIGKMIDGLQYDYGDTE